MADRIESRLTVIEVHHCQSVHGRWTEVEAWWWRRGDAHALRYRLAVNGRHQIRFGDLIGPNGDPHQLYWWNNREERRAGWLLLISAIEQLPPLPA